MALQPLPCTCRDGTTATDAALFALRLTDNPPSVNSVHVTSARSREYSRVLKERDSLLSCGDLSLEWCQSLGVLLVQRQEFLVLCFLGGQRCLRLLQKPEHHQHRATLAVILYHVNMIIAKDTGSFLSERQKESSIVTAICNILLWFSSIRHTLQICSPLK